MPYGREQYGITDGLDALTLERIQTGFDEIRAITGWENFRIPAYVWTYIDDYERDRLLSFLTTAMWTVRDNGNWTTNGVSKETHLVWAYVQFMLNEWWVDIPATHENTMASLVTDWGFTEAAVSTLNPSTWDEGGGVMGTFADGTIGHPSGLAQYATTIYFDSETGYIVAQADIRCGGNASDYISNYARAGDSSNSWLSDNSDGLYGAAGLYYNDQWDDYGVEAEWPVEPVLINWVHEILSGSADYK